MPKSSIPELVQAALDRLPPQHTEEVVHDMFEIIQKDPALLPDYKVLCEQHQTPRRSGPGNVNPKISTCVKKKTGQIDSFPAAIPAPGAGSSRPSPGWAEPSLRDLAGRLYCCVLRGVS